MRMKCWRIHFFKTPAVASYLCLLSFASNISFASAQPVSLSPLDVIVGAWSNGELIWVIKIESDETLRITECNYSWTKIDCNRAFSSRILDQTQESISFQNILPYIGSLTCVWKPLGSDEIESECDPLPFSGNSRDRSKSIWARSQFRDLTFGLPRSISGRKEFDLGDGISLQIEREVKSTQEVCISETVTQKNDLVKIPSICFPL